MWQWLHLLQTPERIQDLIYIIAFAYAEMRVDHYLSLIQECHAFYHNHPHFFLQHYETPKDYFNHSGCYAEEIENGFYVTQEMRDLLWQIHHAGIDIYVISSSDYYDVLGAATNPAFAFPPIKEFFTMKQEVRDGILCPKHIPLPYWSRKQGKADTVNQILRPRYNEPPLLVVGDSEGDDEMMSQCEAKVVLQINRGNGGLHALKEKALAQKQEGTIYLLQGVDRSHHCFRPDQKSIPVGGKNAIF